MIARKLKTCKTCQTEQYLFSHGNCQSCWAKNKATEDNLKPVKPRKPLKQYNTKAIKKVSDTQIERLKRYRIARDEYFKQQPICEYPNCDSKNITLHHMKGKIGELLWDKKWFKSLCMYHHRIVEESPLEAKILKLSSNRLDNYDR